MKKTIVVFSSLFLVYAVAILTVLSALSTSSCAKAPPNLSPSGVAAFHGTQVVKALDLVRDTAIVAEMQQPPLVRTETARAIIVWHRAAVMTIGASPGGWKPTVSAGLDAIDRALSDSERATLTPYIALARTLIAEVQ
jgi:hypothetical protein